MPHPAPEDQVQFLFKIQRLLSEGSFVSTYKYALLLALADLAVERGDDTTEQLSLDTIDLAEKFIDLYWRQVLPWMPAEGGQGGRLHQNTGSGAAILRRLAEAHARSQGLLSRIQADKRQWQTLVRDVTRVIEIMPLWKLQTVAGRRLDFLYPNVGRGRVLRLRGEAIFCFRRFRGLIGDMTEAAWVRFVRRLPKNRPLLGDSQDLQEFLFGADRAALSKVRQLLREHDENRCFYCGSRIRGEGAVDHFIPWASYHLDLKEVARAQPRGILVRSPGREGRPRQPRPHPADRRLGVRPGRTGRLCGLEPRPRRHGQAVDSGWRALLAQ